MLRPEAGQRPNRRNQDQLCQLFGTGPVELGFGHDYREPEATTGSTSLEGPIYTLGNHKELSALADMTLATIEYWAGRPRQGLLIAERGLFAAPGGTCRAFLWSEVARAAALRGDEQRAVEAIAASRRARDASAAPTELCDHIGGEFGFSLARQASSFGGTYLELGWPDEVTSPS